MVGGVEFAPAIQLIAIRHVVVEQISLALTGQLQ